MTTATLHIGLTRPTTDTALAKALGLPDVTAGRWAVASDDDSFLEWGEARRADAEAQALFGCTDRAHATITYPTTPACAASDGALIYQRLVDAGIADPTANCHPAEGDVPWAVTDPDDWSIVLAAVQVAG